MKRPSPVVVDFETRPIESRPNYPPEPVGVSIKKPGRKPKYYSWGHPINNNCTKSEALAALKEVWKGPLLFHNAKFDTDVAEVHMGLPLPHWTQVHDTTFLVFLDDPHQREMGLKPAAHRLCGMPPDEKDAVVEWLLKNQPLQDQGIKLSRAKSSKVNQYAGAWVCLAPGDLVGEYANGDVLRTAKLFELLWTRVVKDRSMGSAYDRERRLMFALLESERHGIRVDLKRLRADVQEYRKWFIKITDWCLKKLGGGEEDNLNSGSQLVDLLMSKGLVDLERLGQTEKGAWRTDTDALDRAVTDRVLSKVLQYRAQLKTCLFTFLEKWLEMAEASGGYIYTNWNQIKGDFGTRTGRLSSTPNFQNIPKEFEPLFLDSQDAAVKRSTKHLPKCPWPDLPPLPLCRSYIIAYEDDEVLLDRDYSQQEPRILAHFEGGALMEQYQANPWIDYHDNARDHLERILGRKFERKPVKNINLGIIYGQGVGSLAERNGSTVEETKRLRDAIFSLYPGLKQMYRDMAELARENQPIVTWGGREYYCEPAKIVNGQIKQFDYKMVNLLVQGSAADCTKEAVIRFYDRTKELGTTWKLLLQVHDEILISAKRSEALWAMEELRKCMESVEFDVQILSEGSWSDKNWAELLDHDKKDTLTPTSFKG